MDEKLGGQNRAAQEEMDGIFQGKNRQRLIIAAGILGIALILLSEFWPKETKTTSAKASAEEFVTKTEEKLNQIVGSIQGAGQCQVMVTLENGVEYVYASQQKVNTDRTEDTASDSNKISQRDGTEQNIIIVDTDNGRAGAAGHRNPAHGEGGGGGL